MKNNDIINWLLDSDPSIQYQVYRDLLGIEKPKIQDRISKEGWGKRYLSLQKPDGYWSRSFYQPKWISAHYTLLDLRNLNISQSLPSARKIIDKVLLNEMNHRLEEEKGSNIIKTDVCVNGMVLYYASYFQAEEEDLIPIVDYLLNNQMQDGGFNCHSTRVGAVHSSLHTTLSVLEGLYEFRKNGNNYKEDEIKSVENQCVEFILQHKLYKSDKTNEIIKNSFTMLSFPARWKYDILRCLDFMQYANIQYDERMNDAIEVLLKKRRNNGLWPLQAKHSGLVHFDMEKPGNDSKWNTLRALRVLKHFDVKY